MSDVGFAIGNEYEPEPLDEGKPPKEKSSKEDVKKLLADIGKAEKYHQEWFERSKKITKIYVRDGEGTATIERKYAMLWSNIEVLKTAVYARQPSPSVSRRFMDRDPVGRHTSELLERSITSVFDREDVHDCMEAVRDETVKYDFVHWADFIHPKNKRWSGLPWVARKVYLTKAGGTKRFGKEKWELVRQADTQKSKTDNHYSGKGDDKSCIYELWHKTKKMVYWVANGVEEFLDEKPPLYDLKGFFPCPRPAYATKTTDGLLPIADYVYYQDQAEEIDDLTKKISDLTDALKLTGFYPSGMEGGVSEALEGAIQATSNNTLIPIPAYSQFQQAGGVNKLIEWWPVDTVIIVLKSAIESRRQLIDDVYQITGISDILRGDSEAQETLGAQQLKAQWGGIRIRSRQAEIARFAKDLAYITAEILSEVFDPETLFTMTGMKFPTTQEKQMLEQLSQQIEQQAQLALQPPSTPAGAAVQGAGVEPGVGTPPLPAPAAPTPQGMQPPQIQQQPQAPQVPQEMPPQYKRMLTLPTKEEILDLLQNDTLRSYRIDIETDSTVQADEQAEKASRNEFLQVVGSFMQSAVPMAQGEPTLVPIMGEMLMFVVRGYRTGRGLEDVIQESIEELTEKAKNAGKGPPPVDPKLKHIEGQLALGKQKMDADMQERVARFQADQAKLQADQGMEERRIAIEEARHASSEFSEERKSTAEAQTRADDASRQERVIAADAEKCRIDCEQVNRRYVMERDDKNSRLEMDRHDKSARLEMDKEKCSYDRMNEAKQETVRVQEKADTAKAAERPVEKSEPVIVNLHVEGSKGKKINLKRDGEGKLTGADVKEQ